MRLVYACNCGLNSAAEERGCEVKDQGDIPLILNDHGEPLVYVRDVKDYAKSTSKQGKHGENADSPSRHPSPIQTKKRKDRSTSPPPSRPVPGRSKTQKGEMARPLTPIPSPSPPPAVVRRKEPQGMPRRVESGDGKPTAPLAFAQRKERTAKSQPVDFSEDEPIEPPVVVRRKERVAKSQPVDSSEDESTHLLERDFKWGRNAEQPVPTKRARLVAALPARATAAVRSPPAKRQKTVELDGTRKRKREDDAPPPAGPSRFPGSMLGLSPEDQAELTPFRFQVGDAIGVRFYGTGIARESPPKPEWKYISMLQNEQWIPLMHGYRPNVHPLEEEKYLREREKMFPPKNKYDW